MESYQISIHHIYHPHKIRFVQYNFNTSRCEYHFGLKTIQICVCSFGCVRFFLPTHSRRPFSLWLQSLALGRWYHCFFRHASFYLHFDIYFTVCGIVHIGTNQVAHSIDGVFFCQIDYSSSANKLGVGVCVCVRVQCTQTKT